MKGRIYSKMGLLGKESPISEILQGSVNTMLNAEIDNFFLTEEGAAGTANKQNGKRVIREIGNRNGGFEPERLANVKECLYGPPIIVS